MKRLLGILTALVIIFGTVSYTFAEESGTVVSYDFDLFPHFSAEAFPSGIRSHMQGYADLVNMLEIRGNFTYFSDNDAFELNAEIIPVTNPEASISFRLFGVSENIGLTSPLLGKETVWFYNYLLMEFAYKTWNNLHFPLQYAALLYPYVTRNAFRQMTNAFHKKIRAPLQSAEIPLKSLQELSKSWRSILQNDDRLIYWIAAVSAPSDDCGALETEFAHIPDYLLDRVACGQSLTVSVDGNTTVWKNKDQNILFTRSDTDTSTEWSVTLPETDNGYLPLLSFSSVIRDNLLTLRMDGSLNMTRSAAENRTDLPVSLLDFSLALESFPVAWPQTAAFSADLSVQGVLFPQLSLVLHGSGSEDGAFSLSIMRSAVNDPSASGVFSCSGTIVPVEPPASVHHYTASEMRGHDTIFTVNDQTLDDFVHRIWRPLFSGILDFLNELPASSCQSVMDDLEEYGVLEMISGQ